METEIKSTRGGRRERSGRKAKFPEGSTTIAFRIGVDTKAFLDASSWDWRKAFNAMVKRRMKKEGWNK